MVCSDWSYSGDFQEQSKKKSSKSTLEMKVEHTHKLPDGFEMIGLSVCEYAVGIFFIHTDLFL